MAPKHKRSASDDDALRHPTTKRAKEIDQHPPMTELTAQLKKQKDAGTPRNVLHWFRSKDIRMQDNKALAAASKKVKEGKGHLITLYLFSPKDMDWHGTSPVRTDLILQSLALLQNELADKNIPLAFLTAQERKGKVDAVMEFCEKHDISHIYANIEYEIDELRRDIKMAKRAAEGDLCFTALHDQTVMEPLKLLTGAGTPMKVFTPYHKAWVAGVKAHPDLIKLAEDPAANDKSITSDKNLKDLFNGSVPDLPATKQFSSTADRDRLRKLWPAGHEAATDRLDHFLSKKVDTYARDRSNPAKNNSSRLSPYLASGIISVREALAASAKHNSSGTDFSEAAGDPGIASWARELVFREFYRSTLVGSPHDAMNLPHNLKFDNVKWESDEEGWRKWCEGTTGVPFVDAGMRQLAREGFMHNRLRMNTASYLRTNLLLDYRRGERYFAEHLVDWDLANNTNGWEPSYTVFNPVSQAERNDPDGDYIRKWVPELKDVKGKAVFSPHDRLDKKTFEKLGYPRPHVEFSATKDRCMQRYKRDLAAADP